MLLLQLIVTEHYKLLCHFASNVPVVTNAMFSQIQLNTRCNQNSSLSSNHSEIIKKLVTPAIHISITFQNLGLIPELSRPGKRD